MTFREGGAFDFHNKFEQIKERLYQAYMVARESGQRATNEVDMANVHLEQLPAYEPPLEAPVRNNDEGPRILSPTPIRPALVMSPTVPRDSGVEGLRSPLETQAEMPKPPKFTPPDEPPPGYEEAQAQAVGIDLDQRSREHAERQSDSSPSEVI